VGIWTLSWKYTSSRISQNKTLWYAGPQVCSMEQCRAWHYVKCYLIEEGRGGGGNSKRQTSCSVLKIGVRLTSLQSSVKAANICSWTTRHHFVTEHHLVQCSDWW
jgi:hypothetical protein